MNMTILLALGRFTADRYGARAVLPVFFLGAIGGGAVYRAARRPAPTRWSGRRGRSSPSSGSGSPGTGGGTARAGSPTGPVLRRVVRAGADQRRDSASGCRGCWPGRRISAASSSGSPAAGGWRAGRRGASARPAPRRGGSGHGGARVAPSEDVDEVEDDDDRDRDADQPGSDAFHGERSFGCCRGVNAERRVGVPLRVRRPECHTSRRCLPNAKKASLNRSGAGVWCGANRARTRTRQIG